MPDAMKKMMRKGISETVKNMFVTKYVSVSKKR